MTRDATSRIEQALSHGSIRACRQRRVARWRLGPAYKLSEMVDIRHAESIRSVLRVGGHFTDGRNIFGLQAIGNTHFIEIRVAGKRKNGGILVLPAKLSDSCLARRFENRDLNRLTMNHAIGSGSLVGRNRKVRLVVDRLYESITERIKHRTQSSVILCVGHMFLGLRTYGTVIN